VEAEAAHDHLFRMWSHFRELHLQVLGWLFGQLYFIFLETLFGVECEASTSGWKRME